MERVEGENVPELLLHVSHERGQKIRVRMLMAPLILKITGRLKQLLVVTGRDGGFEYPKNRRKSGRQFAPAVAGTCAHKHHAKSRESNPIVRDPHLTRHYPQGTTKERRTTVLTMCNAVTLCGHFTPSCNFITCGIVLVIFTTPT